MQVSFRTSELGGRPFVPPSAFFPSKRTKSTGSEDLLDAITKTDIHTIVGPVKWTGSPVKNVCTTPVVAGQWQKKGDRLDVAIVNSGEFPEIKTTSKLLPLA